MSTIGKPLSLKKDGKIKTKCSKKEKGEKRCR